LGAAIYLCVLVMTACTKEGDSRPRPPSPPRIVFAGTQYDFGRVEQGTVVRRAFPFVNEGEQEATIGQMRTACDCVATTGGERPVPPGASGSIEVEFATRNVFGPQRRTVTVYVNDPDKPVTLLELKGEVVLDVATEPDRLYVGRVRPGETFWREVAVLAAGSVRILSVEGDGTRIVTRAEPLDDGQNGRRIQVSIRPDATLGPVADTIVIRTTSTRRAVIRVPVVGVVEGQG